MRAAQLITEGRVRSSWIARIDYEDDENLVVLSLKSGAQYEVDNVPAIVFRAWLRAPSKGKFWHKRIRGKFAVYRIE